MHIKMVRYLGAFKLTMEWGSEEYCYKTAYRVGAQRLFIIYSDWL